jgi:hypothetical protein
VSKPIVRPYIASSFGDSTVGQRIVGRALARAGFGKLAYATRVRRKWDQSLSARLNEWRASVGITNRDPEYTREDHAKLARWWDKRNIVDAHVELARRAENTREAAYRARVVAQCAFLLSHAPEMPYSQDRPYSRKRPPTKSDCSGSSAWVEEYAGGERWGLPWGWGNTWTQTAWFKARNRLLVAGRAAFVGIAKAGDRIFYGKSQNNPSHTAVYLGVGSDGRPRSFQFGRYPCRVAEVDYRPDRVAIYSAWNTEPNV